MKTAIKILSFKDGDLVFSMGEQTYLALKRGDIGDYPIRAFQLPHKDNLDYLIELNDAGVIEKIVCTEV